MAAPLGTQIRERILESAAALMEERSFFDISLADIARAARISKGTLYYYYNSRDAILFDLTDRYLQKLSDDLLAWVDNEEKDTSLPRLLRYTFSRGVYDKSGSMRLFLIAEAVSGRAMCGTSCWKSMLTLRTYWRRRSRLVNPVRTVNTWPG
ncbi:MAG: TetR/AcrR family transcriptional regulator [Ruthenibacterium lactatiformans]